MSNGYMFMDFVGPWINGVGVACYKKGNKDFFRVETPVGVVLTRYTPAEGFVYINPNCGQDAHNTAAALSWCGYGADD